MTTVTTDVTISPLRAGMLRLGDDGGVLLARGAIAGLAAGLGFILANMWYAVGNGKPAVAPFLAISTIFHGSAMPVMTPQAIPGEVVTGLVMHTALSITFGMGFALLAVFLRNPGQLAAAAVLYGLALFVLNIEILGRTAFPFFTNPHGPNTVFEGLVHPLIFGGLLIPFFLGNRPGLARDPR
ncbi:MAG: hypothetical protein ACR2GZ_09280 [Solirubrobacteraceae bacterium]